MPLACTHFLSFISSSNTVLYSEPIEFDMTSIMQISDFILPELKCDQVSVVVPTIATLGDKYVLY